VSTRPEPFAIRLDAAGRILTLNDNAAALLEVQAADLVGLSSLRLVCPPDVAGVRSAWSVAVSNPPTRVVAVARLSTGSGRLVPAELILMNLGSESAPHVVAEVRPRLPEPPHLQTGSDNSAKRENPAHSPFELLQAHDGLSCVQGLLDQGSRDFVVVMFGLRNVQNQLGQLIVTLCRRLRSTMPGADCLFQQTHNHFFLVVEGTTDRKGIGTVIDRLQECVGALIVPANGSTLGPLCPIGVAIPSTTSTPERIISEAHIQLRRAEKHPGPFPYSIGKPPRDRTAPTP